MKIRGTKIDLVMDIITEEMRIKMVVITIEGMIIDRLVKTREEMGSDLVMKRGMIIIGVVTTIEEMEISETMDTIK